MKRRNVLILMGLFILIIGCTNSLTRSNAKKQILNEMKDEWKTFRIAVSTRFTDGSVEEISTNINVVDLPESSISDLKRIEKILSDANVIVDNDYNPLIKPYIDRDGNNRMWDFIPLGSAKKIEVDGIKTINDNYKKVEFSVFYEWNNLAKELGCTFPLVVKRVIGFEKYDDGWRIDID
ncbi:MAG TPA: hypothetical protein PLW31_05140 [Bacteroidales bacterium]|nr:hypothetical protein [Bacteroidales bacterium]HOX77407.1 hypothetical protein [Bacteroidales bacterium]HPM93569.1 hypothetical protein [Bacteroidales bacterium]